tara:strand:+ start:862 stop:2946 length:2085 start_codon:yes stop_codon:yes gene_type:complete
MAIQFQRPQSMYVDPRSVQIGDKLRDRFASNFQAADALEAQLATLKVADFEGDQQMKKQLMDSTRSKLEQLAGRGDYENLSMPVAKSAREFQTRYTPLEENYNKYQKYVEDISSKYKAGEIDAETYKQALPASKKGYTGIQVDAEGNIDPDSYFGGMSLVKDVNIQELLEKNIKGIVAEESGQMIQKVGQGPNGMYAITESGNVISVSEERVKAVYDAVISQPDVKAALSQKATLRTYNLEEQDINNAVNSDSEMYREEIAKGQELLTAGGITPQQTVQLQREMSVMEQNINTLANMTDAEKQSYIKQREVAGILKPIESAFLAKNVYSKSPASSNYIKTDWDKKWMADYNSALVEGREIRKEGRDRVEEDRKASMGAIAFRSPGNLTVEREKDPKEIVAGLTASIGLMNEYADRAKNGNLSPEALRQNKAAQVQAAIQYDLQSNRLKGAARKAGIFAGEEEKFNEFSWYTNLTSSERNKIKNVFTDDTDGNKYYYKDPTNLMFQTSDSANFEEFEDAFKEAFPTLPEGTKVKVLDGDEFVDGDLTSFTDSNGNQLKIVDVGLARQPISGHANTNVIAVTFEGGQMALIDRNLIDSPYLDKISSTAAFRLNSVVPNIAANPEYNYTNPYPIKTTYTGSDNLDHNITVNVFPSDDIDKETMFQIERPEDNFISKKVTADELGTTLNITDLNTIIL